MLVLGLTQPADNTHDCGIVCGSGAKCDHGRCLGGSADGGIFMPPPPPPGTMVGTGVVQVGVCPQAAGGVICVDLLSDAEEKACALFGVIKMKNMYGRKVRGIERSTFVIDKSGALAREWRGVKVPGHAQEVLDFAETL